MNGLRDQQLHFRVSKQELERIWSKMESSGIQSVEAAELTRNILIDWIPIFEDKQVEYDIDIPEQPVRVRLDMDSYMRIHQCLPEQ